MGGGGVYSQCVPQVLKCVLKDVPNNTSFFFPYCLAMVHGQLRGGGEKSTTKHASILEREAYLGFYIGGLSPCSKNIGHGPSK